MVFFLSGQKGLGPESVALDVLRNSGRFSTVHMFITLGVVGCFFAKFHFSTMKTLITLKRAGGSKSFVVLKCI